MITDFTVKKDGTAVFNHHITIYKTYTNDGRTPYKWHGHCTCGWNVLSWSWVQEPEEGWGGAMVHSLCHVGLCGVKHD